MTTPKDHSKRAHAILSASKSSRWLACTPSAAAELTHKEDGGSPYAAEGTLGHEIAELYVRGLKEGYEPTEQDVAALVTELDPDYEYYDAAMVEHAKGYRDYVAEKLTPTAVLLIEQEVDFSEYVEGGSGIADCIIIDNGTLTNIDYKYGVGVKVDATENSQLKLYSLGALKAFEDLYDIHTIKECIYQPRTIPANISEWTITTADLFKWADTELRAKARLAAEGKGEYVAGPYCQFCKHAGSCRALAAKCCDIVKIGTHKATVEKLTSWEIAHIVENASFVTKWLDAVNKEAYKRLMEDGDSIEGLKLVDGKNSYDWTKEADVIAALEAADIPAVKYMTEPKPAALASVAAVKKAIGKKKYDIIANFIQAKAGAPVIAPANDKRAKYNKANDFMDLDAKESANN